jgi:hypothetical protein
MAKKEMRRAARETQRRMAADKAQARRDRKPSWRRSIITGLILTVLWLALSRLFVSDASWPNTLTLAALFLPFYVVFTYLWDSFLYKRKLRRRHEGKG